MWSTSGEIGWKFCEYQAPRTSSNSNAVGRSRKLAQRVVSRGGTRKFPRLCLHVHRVHAARLSPTFPARFQRTPESNFLRLSRLCLLVASFSTISTVSRKRASSLFLDVSFRFICNWNARKNDHGMECYCFLGFLDLIRGTWWNSQVKYRPPVMYGQANFHKGLRISQGDVRGSFQRLLFKIFIFLFPRGNIRVTLSP